MSQHTPGPWETSRDAVPAHHVQITVYAEADGQRVATVFREEANARLVAAAPDLLAACESALSLAQIDADDGELALAALEVLRPVLRNAIATLSLK